MPCCPLHLSIDILGAIAALGKAGEWEACVDFWYTDEGKNIGQVSSTKSNDL